MQRDAEPMPPHPPAGFPARRILALNAYHGGSHRAFLEGWSTHSRHEFTVLTLPPYKWKWRMRHAAISFAEEVTKRLDQGQRWDALFCTDMLNLAEFRGLLPAAAGQLPAVIYFHENQLTYPDQQTRERDLHFGFTNLVSCLAADRVWFNSAYHQGEFLAALSDTLHRMPDHRPLRAVDQIRERAEVHPPGIEEFAASRCPWPASEPLRVAWAARWEHDKAPEQFFAALRLLRQRGIPFRLSVLGESFGNVPPCFPEARREFAAEILRWGYQRRRADYLTALAESDVFVSTANHEFFGIAMVEALAAGCFPVAPCRLAYPEVLGPSRAWFYDGTTEGLAGRLAELDEQRRRRGRIWDGEDRQAEMRQRFGWHGSAAGMDEALVAVQRRT